MKINLPGVNIWEDGPSRVSTYKDVKKESEWRSYWEKLKRKAWINNSSVEERYKRRSLTRSKTWNR